MVHVQPPDMPLGGDYWKGGFDVDVGSNAQPPVWGVVDTHAHPCPTWASVEVGCGASRMVGWTSLGGAPLLMEWVAPVCSGPPATFLWPASKENLVTWLADIRSLTGGPGSPRRLTSRCTWIGFAAPLPVDCA